MANFKSKVSQKKPAKPLAVSQSQNEPAASQFAADLLTVTSTLAALPPLTDVQRKAFEGQFSVERCDKAGVRTKAADVLADGVAWVPIIHKTLTAQSDAVRRYRLSRFVWLLESLQALASAIEAQKTGVGSVEEARKRAENAYNAAAAMREDLLLVLGTLAGDTEADRNALETARGKVTDANTLAASLKSLATLAGQWLKREDAAAKALVESVDLTKADIDKAHRDADELIAATSSASVEGKREVRDTPPVNRIEGRVLLEMQLVMGIFESAHKRNKMVPRLIPGAGTRSFLAPKRIEGPVGPGQDPTATTDLKGATGPIPD
jgi:hypothetical protein